MYINQLISFYNGILTSIIICFIIYRLNTDIKSPSILNYFFCCLIIALFSSQINFIFPELNDMVRILLNLMVTILVIKIFLKYSLFYSLLTSFLAVILLGVGDIFVTLAYVYPLKLRLIDYRTSIVHISAGSALLFAFTVIILKFISSNCIKLKRRLSRKYQSITVILSVNLIASFFIFLFFYCMFAYELGYRKVIAYNGSVLWGMSIVAALLIIIIIGTLYLVNYLTVEKIRNDRLKMSHVMDVMTETLNRESGIMFLQKQLEVCKNTNKELTVCYLDVNNLKLINDTLGHKEGDKLIKTIIEIIKDNIRITDVISRLGGDEFIIVFPDCNIEYGKRVMKRIEEKLTMIKLFKNYTISFSYGFSEYKASNFDITAEDLLDLADQEMYENKRAVKSLA